MSPNTRPCGSHVICAAERAGCIVTLTIKTLVILIAALMLLSAMSDEIPPWHRLIMGVNLLLVVWLCLT